MSASAPARTGLPRNAPIKAAMVPAPPGDRRSAAPARVPQLCNKADPLRSRLPDRAACGIGWLLRIAVIAPAGVDFSGFLASRMEDGLAL